MNPYYILYSADNYDDEPIGDERIEEDTDDATETKFRNLSRFGTSSNNNNNNDNNNNSSNNNNNYGGSNELHEQMYQHKLNDLLKQLDELNQLKHPEYIKRVGKLENNLQERRQLNEIYKDYMRDCVERDYILEKMSAQKEYEEKIMDLKDNLIADLEDRKRQIENERCLELTNDLTDIKVTRKLRRRPNEPLPEIENPQKPATGLSLVNYQLDDKEIEMDLKMIQQGMNSDTNSQEQAHNLLGDPNSCVKTGIEDRDVGSEVVNRSLWWTRTRLSLRQAFQ